MATHRIDKLAGDWFSWIISAVRRLSIFAIAARIRFVRQQERPLTRLFPETATGAARVRI